MSKFEGKARSLSNWLVNFPQFLKESGTLSSALPDVIYAMHLFYLFVELWAKSDYKFIFYNYVSKNIHLHATNNVA